MFQFLRRIFTFRASPNSGSTSLANPSTWLTALFAPLSKSGVQVSTESVVGITAVWRAINVLADSISSIPFEVVETQDDDSVRRRRDHPLNYILSEEPSQLYTSFTFRHTLIAHTLLTGNGYAYIDRQGNGRPRQFLLLDPTRHTIKPIVGSTGELFYKVTGLQTNFPFREKLEGELIPARDMIHIQNMTLNGITGLDVIDTHRDNYGFGLASRDLGNFYMKNRAHLGGYIRHPQTLGDTAYNRLKSSWNKAFAGVAKAGETAILEEGAEYVPISVDLQKAQMLDSQKFSIEDVSRIFGVPQHLLSSLDRATFNNIEQLSYEFAVFSVRPWVERFEAEFSRKCFLESERGRVRARLDMNAFLRGDTESRANYMQKLFMSGVLSINDIRRAEGFNPIDGGDRHFVPLNMVPLDQAGQANGQQNAPASGQPEPAENQMSNALDWLPRIGK